MITSIHRTATVWHNTKYKIIWKYITLNIIPNKCALVCVDKCFSGDRLTASRGKQWKYGDNHLIETRFLLWLLFYFKLCSMPEYIWSIRLSYNHDRMQSVPQLLFVWFLVDVYIQAPTPKNLKSMHTINICTHFIIATRLNFKFAIH